jgi:hypothetical protein
MFLFETRRTVSSETPLRRIIVIIFSIYSLPNLFTSEKFNFAETQCFVRET